MNDTATVSDSTCPVIELYIFSIKLIVSGPNIIAIKAIAKIIFSLGWPITEYSCNLISLIRLKWRASASQVKRLVKQLFNYIKSVIMIFYCHIFILSFCIPKSYIGATQGVTNTKRKCEAIVYISDE